MYRQILVNFIAASATAYATTVLFASGHPGVGILALLAFFVGNINSLVRPKGISKRSGGTTATKPL